MNNRHLYHLLTLCHVTQCLSDYRFMGHEFDPGPPAQAQTFVKIVHEIFSPVILLLLLSQEGMLSVTREHTVKSLLEAHALKEAHSSVWTPKRRIFQANFPKNRAFNKGPPTNIEKKIGPALCRNISNFLLAANL